MANIKRSTHTGTAAVSNTQHIVEREREMLRSEFEVMQRLDFTFIKEIGANDAEEYIIKITTLEFLQDGNSERKNDK